MGLLIKLQNGDTALKSLKFGNDRLGGGSSNQPYIKNPILDEPGQLSLADDDFLLRGGLKAPINAIEDVARLSKYMFDFRSPKGLLFIAKQNILSRVAVPNEAAQKWGINNPGAGYAGGALNQGVYTPLSTLLQAGVGFTGTHLNLMGINPFSPMTGVIDDSFLPGIGLKRYEDVVKQKNQSSFNNLTVNFPIGTVENALTLIKNPLTKGLPPFAQTKLPPPVPAKSVNIGTFHNRLLDLWYNKNFNVNSDTNILQYGGGPGSILGVGKTRINFADNQRTGVNNPLFSTNKKYFINGGKTAPTQYISLDKEGNYTFASTLNYNGLLGASIQEGLTPFESGINDNGQIFTLYSSEVPYATLSKYNPTGMPLSGSGGYQIGLQRPKTEVNYNNLLGASIAEGLNDAQTGIDPITGINSNLYNPDTDNSTLSKNNQGLTLTGSEAYQANRLLSIINHNIEPTYVSPINTILSKSGTGNTQGVSGSGRQLVTDLKYDQTIGTFVLQGNNDKNLGEYSSKNTLWNDNLNESYEVSPKNHKEGYLANLDKNAGYYIDKKGNYTFALAQYPRNIAPDFRKTDRATRGFTDFSTNVKGTNYVRGSYDIITTAGSNYTDTDNYSSEKTVDQIYYSSEQKRTSRSINNGYDLIKFRIGIVNPTNPTNITALNFRAYIDDFSDSYSSDWKDQTYMGRAEKFHKYSSFNRSVSLGFTIVADNKANLNIMYEQLNTLAASLAPTYTTFGYMAGNLHQLTIGDYLVNQTGTMSGLTYEVIDDSPWEIDEGNQLPLYIKVSGIKFTPIHSFRPESQFNGVHAFIKQ